MPARSTTAFARSAVLLAAIVLAASADGSPERARWHRMSLIGENAEHYFRFVAERDQPGSYYTYSETLRLQKVSKAHLRIVEDTLVRVVTFNQDPDTLVWTSSVDPQPPFDLAGYLRTSSIHLAFADDAAPLVVDSAGAWIIDEGLRERVIDSRELARQIPELGDEPRVVGVESTGLPESPGHSRLVFYRVLSNTKAWDGDWSEDLLLVPQAALLEAWDRLQARRNDRNRRNPR